MSPGSSKSRATRATIKRNFGRTSFYGKSRLRAAPFSAACNLEAGRRAKHHSETCKRIPRRQELRIGRSLRWRERVDDRGRRVGSLGYPSDENKNKRSRKESRREASPICFRETPAAKRGAARDYRVLEKSAYRKRTISRLHTYSFYSIAAQIPGEYAC